LFSSSFWLFNYFSAFIPPPNIIRVIKLRKMRWAGYVARMGRGHAYRVLVGKPEGKGQLGRLGIDWIILKLILEK
jgi:hypothetical protein